MIGWGFTDRCLAPLFACCCRGLLEGQEGWIWGYGLPAHLWGASTFRLIGDQCGGLLEVETPDRVIQHNRYDTTDDVK